MAADAVVGLGMGGLGLGDASGECQWGVLERGSRHQSPYIFVGFEALGVGSIDKLTSRVRKVPKSSEKFQPHMAENSDFLCRFLSRHMECLRKLKTNLPDGPLSCSGVALVILTSVRLCGF